MEQADVAGQAQPGALPPLPGDGSLEKKEKTVKVKVADQTVNVHMVEMTNSKADTSNALCVLFLHGASFSSEHWLEIRTLEQVSNWGHRAVAIDLPGGKGKTSGTIHSSLHADFLEAIIKVLDLKKIVIVSPSMSGCFSLPFLFQEPRPIVGRVVGYVPVSPIQTSDFRQQYPHSQLRTLIVYGVNDSMAPGVLRDLELLPNRQVSPIEDAGHACYMNRPDAFHRTLYQFLERLK